MTKGKLKKYAVFCLKLGFAVFIFWYLFSSGRLTVEIFARIFSSNILPYFILSGLAFLFSQMIAALRLSVLLKAADLPFPYFFIFKLVMIGNFFNIAIPGAVGGDVVKGTYLFRNETERRGRSTGIVLMDRIIGFLSLCTIGALSVVYLLNKKKTLLASYADIINTVFAATGAVAILFMALLVLGRKKEIRAKIKAVISKLFRRTMFYHMIDAVGALAKKGRIVFYAFLLSAACQLVLLCGLMMLINLETGSVREMINLAAASTVVMLFSVVPVTPGNIGWTELVASIGWAAVGSPAGAAVFFLWRLVCVVFSLPGAYLYFSTSSRLVRAAGDNPPEQEKK